MPTSISCVVPSTTCFLIACCISFILLKDFSTSTHCEVKELIFMPFMVLAGTGTIFPLLSSTILLVESIQCPRKISAINSLFLFLFFIPASIRTHSNSLGFNFAWKMNSKLQGIVTTYGTKL